MQRLIWPTVFVTACPATLLASFLLLSSITPKAPTPNLALLPPPQVLSASTDIASTQPTTVTSSITFIDGRAILLKNYLRKYKSILEPHAEEMVILSDKYGIDYRLLVAIAQQESNLCKRIPINSNNCWGHGIYGNKVTRYPSLMAGAEAVLKTLVKYKKSGLHTPEEIMTRYTPPAVASGSWAKGINEFLSELD